MELNQKNQHLEHEINNVTTMYNKLNDDYDYLVDVKDAAEERICHLEALYSEKEC